MIPKLLPIDLSRSDGHTHPDIKTDGRYYLCRIGGGLFCGKFRPVWFGLNFSPWINGPVGIQFDAPGTNRSHWEAVWEITGWLS